MFWNGHVVAKTRKTEKLSKTFMYLKREFTLNGCQYNRRSKITSLPNFEWKWLLNGQRVCNKFLSTSTALRFRNGRQLSTPTCMARQLARGRQFCLQNENRIIHEYVHVARRTAIPLLILTWLSEAEGTKLSTKRNYICGISKNATCITVFDKNTKHFVKINLLSFLTSISTSYRLEICILKI